nr:ribosome-associated translation inhibitor RaiA [uncultured Romboutsia sp.]
MAIHIVSKKVTLTNSIKNKIENTLVNLEKYISDDTDIHVKLDVKKKDQKIEVTIFTKNGTILRAEDSKDNLYTAIDSVYDKLYKQIRKLKTQLIKKNKSNESIRFNSIDEYVDLDTSDNMIKRYKKFNFDKPMSIEDAVIQMDMLGHKFFIFRNIESEDICVIYKRHDGYGLIEQV